MLDYEKLDVDQCAIEHLAFVFESIPNLAEAVGKTSAADRSNRYAIARGEAMECGAIVDVVRLIGVVPEPELPPPRRSSSGFRPAQVSGIAASRRCELTRRHRADVTRVGANQPPRSSLLDHVRAPARHATDRKRRRKLFTR